VFIQTNFTQNLYLLVQF